MEESRVATSHMRRTIGVGISKRSTRAGRGGRALGVIGLTGALLLAACGDDDAASDDAVTDTGQSATASGDTGAVSSVPADTTEPVRGGTLVVGVEADTARPWKPDDIICTEACAQTIEGTVYEPVVVAGLDGEIYPYLVESLEPNADYTEWTFEVREGITFHDGTPLDAAALAYNLQPGPTDISMEPVADIQHDGAMTVTVTLNTPWPAFPHYLVYQVGYVASPTWLQAVEAGEADAAEPVGTGPFEFESYESGESGRLRATRFEDYWRGDAPDSTGEGLPHLDAVEVRFMPDADARTRALAAGDVDLIVTNTGSEVSRLQDESGVEMLAMDSHGLTTTFHVLINNADQLAGEDNVFADERVRRALAMATDKEPLAAAGTGNVFEAANSPFPPGRPGYLDDPGAPEFDPDAARALLDEVKSDTGESSIPVSLKTPTGAQNATMAELLQSMWEDAGFEVSIDQVPEGELFEQLLTGDFQLVTFDRHVGRHVDQQYIWWSSTTQGEGMSLNFGRIYDPTVDELLETIRAEPDEAAFTEPAEELNRYLMEHAHLIPIWWEHPYQAFREEVHHVGVMNLPGESEPVPIEARVTPTEIFKTG